MIINEHLLNENFENINGFEKVCEIESLKNFETSSSFKKPKALTNQKMKKSFKTIISSFKI